MSERPFRLGPDWVEGGVLWAGKSARPIGGWHNRIVQLEGCSAGRQSKCGQCLLATQSRALRSQSLVTSSRGPACNFFTLCYIKITQRRLRRNLIAAEAAPFPFQATWLRFGIRPERMIFRMREIGLAKEELITMEGEIDEILPDGRFGVILDNEHRIIAYTAGKMRRYRIRSVVGDRVHVEMTPYDLTKGRIVYRERTPGQGPGGGRSRGFRR